jgi:AsmA family protein
LLRPVLSGLGTLLWLPVLGIAAYLALGHVDFAELAASQASAALGRAVTIDSLRLVPGHWLQVELRGLRIANLEGGTRPEMLTLGRASLQLDLLSLLDGPPRLRAVEVERFSLYLERVGAEQRNWRFGPPREPSDAPPDRSGVPLLLDAALRDSEVIVRTSRGNLLRTALHRAAVRAEGETGPVRIEAAGAYNGVDVALEGDLDSIARLRDASRPYATRLRLSSGDTRFDFTGHMDDPFDVDGAEGQAALRAPTLDRLLALGGADSAIAGGLDLEGRLVHRGPVWRLTEGRGQFAGETAAVRLAEFTEGGRGEPDAVALDLGLGRLDLNRRLAAGGRSREPEADLPLAVSASPDPLLTARITATELVYSRLEARDVVLEASLQPSRIAVTTLALSTSGARLRASGRVDGRGNGGVVNAEVRMEEGDVDTMRRVLGLRPLPLAGRLNGWLAVQGEGERLNAAASGARVSAVIAMLQGQVAREVIEMASTDVRLLFRRARGMTPVSCLLGMLEMRAGIGEVAPLRIRSAEGQVAGTASFDLNRRQVDLVIGSLRSTTSFWALDIPMRVSGSFANPTIRPARWSADGRARLAAGDAVAPLPPRLRDFAQRNPCFQAAAIPAAPPRSAPPPTTSRSRSQ